VASTFWCTSDIVKPIVIVHSDAIGSMVFFFVMAGSALTLVILLLCLAGRGFRFAGKILGWWSVFALGYTALTIALSLLLPQKVVNPGQSYCIDSWCIGVQKVNKATLNQDVVYHPCIWSTSAAGVSG
jgi:hypothetical protein